MKIKILLLLPILFTVKSFAQNTCCSKVGSTENFAMLTHSQAFVAAHEEPLPFILPMPLGQNITFKCSDGKQAYAYEIKSEQASDAYLFVIHEWWGLNDYIKQESEKYYKSLGNVNVIAIDLYDQQVATNRDSAAKYMQSVKSERAEAIIKGVLTYVGAKARIATVGWCFGGGWSMQASLLASKQAKACVMFYGAPEEKMEKLNTLNAPVLFIWPEQDQWINKAMVDKFETSMNQSKKSLQIVKYNADHAFANPSNPKFNKAFAEDAFSRALNFIRQYLNK